MKVLYEDERIMVISEGVNGEICVRHKENENVVVQIGGYFDDNNIPYLEILYKARATVRHDRSRGSLSIA